MPAEFRKIERNVVLLPAPLAPISATSCPCLIESEMPLDGLDLAVAADEIANL